ncbi:MAG: M20 family metallo-hydrolase [Gemmatimonadota bacterium]|nr:M20 family metallo-hydrolase [Gemmatimonadota bacterium]
MNRRRFVQSASLAAGAAVTAGAVQAASGAAQSRASLRVNGTRVNTHIKELAAFGKNPQGGVSRVAYSEADRQGREYTMGLMRAAQLTVSVDVAGNIWGRRPGSDAALKPIVFGSHIDSVPEGGNYDGDVGVLGSIEVAQSLAEAGATTRHSLEVVVWQNEEGGLWGSHAVTGPVTAQELAQMAWSGKSIRDGIAFLGGDPSKLDSVRRRQGDIAGYLELHIEQGGTLDREKVAIGIVEGIVGIARWRVTVGGFANHAGTTEMAGRRDALLASARLIEAVNRIVTSRPGRQVGTVGRIQAFPGAANVIPGRVEFSIEIRDLDASNIDLLGTQIREEATRIGKLNDTTFSFIVDSAPHKPALSHPALRAHIAAAARQLGLTAKVMPSGAGHDAQNAALIGPMAMIFVPSVGGISHSPREFTTPEDVVSGTNVLLHTLLAFDAAGAPR